MTQSALVLTVLLLVGCVQARWSATYVVQGQEYQWDGVGNDCPQTKDVQVGRTAPSINSSGSVNFGAPVYMTGQLKSGSCVVNAR